ncbi:ATP-binding protein [Streptomyces sp. NPDC055036]
MIQPRNSRPPKAPNRQTDTRSHNVLRAVGAFAAADHEASAVREMLKSELISLGQGALVDDGLLVTHELFANAVRHGSTEPSDTVTVSILWHDRTLRVEVSDTSSTSPCLRDVSPLDTGGRGLPLVQALSNAWGVAPAPHGRAGKTVWFTLCPPTPSPCHPGIVNKPSHTGDS